VAEPSDKAPEIDAFINKAFKVNRREAIRGNQCVICQEVAVTFRDELSRKEFSISGMCQKCQDRAFSGL
jgi:hypothetical protein